MGQQGQYLGLNEGFFRKINFWSNNGGRITLPILFYCAAVITTFVGCLYGLFSSRSNVTIITELVNNLLILMMTFCKTCCLVYHRDRFQHYIFLVRSNFFQPEQNDIPHRHHISQECEKKGRALFLIFTVLCYVSSVGFLLSPLTRLSVRQENLSNSTKEIENDWYLPYYIFFPMEFNTTGKYMVMYLFNITVGVVTDGLIPGLDTFIVTLLSHVCSQFKILNDNLENIQQYAMEYVQKNTHSYNNWYSELKRQNYKLKGEMTEELDEEGIDWSAHLSKHGKQSSDTTSTHLHMEMRRRIKICVKHHQLLIKFVRDFEGIFSSVLLIQFISSTLIFCMTAFSIILLPFGAISNFISLMIAAMLQLFMYCFIGDLLKEQGEAVGLSAYSSQWYDFPEDIKKSFFIIMMGSRRPVVLTIGKFATLTLGTFAATLQASYSYFTLLNEMNGR